MLHIASILWVHRNIRIGFSICHVEECRLGTLRCRTFFMFFQDSKWAAMETFLLDSPKTRPWHVSQLQKVGHIGMTEVKALRPRQSEHRDFKMQRQGKQKMNMTINSACAPIFPGRVMDTTAANYPRPAGIRKNMWTLRRIALIGGDPLIIYKISGLDLIGWHVTWT